MTRALLGAVLTATLLLAGACGEKADGRLSVSEATQELQTGDDLLNLGDADLPTKVYTCIAKAMVDSDLTDKGLEALLDGDRDYVGTDAEAAVLTRLSAQQIEACKAAAAE